MITLLCPRCGNRMDYHEVPDRELIAVYCLCTELVDPRESGGRHPVRMIEIMRVPASVPCKGDPK